MKKKVFKDGEIAIFDYNSLNDTIRLTSAVADYKRKSDGTIEAVWV